MFSGAPEDDGRDGSNQRYGEKRNLRAPALQLPSGRTIRADVKNSVEPLAHSDWHRRIRVPLIEQNDLLQAVEVGRAVCAPVEVLSDLPACSGIQASVELLLNVSCDPAAGK